MQTVDIDSKSAGSYAYAAALNARMTSLVNSSHFSDAQKLQAERMQLAIDLVYSSRGVHVNYRKTQITIKVDQPRVRDRRMLALLEQDWTGAGVVKRVSDQGINYRIARV